MNTLRVAISVAVLSTDVLRVNLVLVTSIRGLHGMVFYPSHFKRTLLDNLTVLSVETLRFLWMFVQDARSVSCGTQRSVSTKKKTVFLLEKDHKTD